MKSRLHHAPKVDTMKCVQVIDQGIPVRLSNADAFQIVVHDLGGRYCPKKVFKGYRAEHPDHPARSRLNGKGHIIDADV